MHQNNPLSRSSAFLRLMESIVLYAIALVLIALAIVLLGSTIFALYGVVVTGHVRESAIAILDPVLLVLMTMEIVYTVALSIESHRLDAEPFLVVGAIGAIRRMLVITAESTTQLQADPAAFDRALIELGLLAVTVLAIAAAVYILRRSQKPSGSEAHESA